MKWLLPSALLLAACVDPGVPPARSNDVYDFRLLTTPPTVLRWPSGSTVRIYATPTAGARADLLEEALERGATVWNAHALYREYELVRTSDIGAADVVLTWSDELPVVDVSGCPPQVARGVTTFCLSDDRAHLAVFPLLPPMAGGGSRVRMVVTILGSEAARAGRVEALVAHELGHVLGIARHSANSNDLMYGGDVTRTTLSPRDAATVRVLYHTRAQVSP